MIPLEDPNAAVERRRNQIRIVLFLIILFTLPFYPLGVWLWISAPDSEAQVTLTESPTETIPPLDNTATEFVTNTPRPSFTPADPLDPTPIQSFPIITQRPPATSVILPTATAGPTITAAPSFTPLPSFTPIPPSNTPPPTVTPLPTATPLPPPTDTPPPPPTAIPQPDPEVTTEAQP